jgi:hypothetical protein
LIIPHAHDVQTILDKRLNAVTLKSVEPQFRESTLILSAIANPPPDVIFAVLDLRISKLMKALFRLQMTRLIPK